MAESGSPYAGTPRWVKVSAIVFVAIVALVAVMLLIGGHEGPSRHAA